MSAPNGEWLVTKRNWEWTTTGDTEFQLRGMAWDLKCQAGHPWRLYTPFGHFSLPINVPCKRCKRAYPATFSGPS
jgi:hypothetical protein